MRTEKWEVCCCGFRASVSDVMSKCMCCLSLLFFLIVLYWSFLTGSLLYCFCHFVSLVNFIILVYVEDCTKHLPLQFGNLKRNSKGKTGLMMGIWALLQLNSFRNKWNGHFKLLCSLNQMESNSSEFAGEQKTEWNVSRTRLGHRLHHFLFCTRPLPGCCPLALWEEVGAVVR